MDVKGYQFVGPRGNELKAKLEKIEPENDETSKRFLQAVDKNVNYKISNEEADKALAALKLFNVGNIKVLTKSEVDKIVSALNPSGKNISGLEALGTVYPAKINGKDYKAVMIEYSKVKELIDLKEIKKDFDEEHDVRRKMKLIMTRGLPASGKTTWAKEQVLNGNGRVKRINKDDLRAMVDAGQWSKSNEKFILKLRDNFVFEALMAGYDVIVDDTNLAPKHEEQLRAIFKTVESGSWFPGGESNMKFEIKDFTDVSLRTCIDRDSARPNSVGEKTIKRMHRQFLRLVPRTFTAPEYNPDLPNCIIVDIDGTLAIYWVGKNATWTSKHSIPTTSAKSSPCAK
jgi:predicted kinase